MQGAVFLKSIRLKNLLSYGSGGCKLDLLPLNVLIGPNASGKSNLIEAISLLAAAPRDLLVPLREGGGVEEWIWKGAESLSIYPKAEIETVLSFPALRYRLEFTAVQSHVQIIDEVIESEFGPDLEPYSFYAFRRGKPVLKAAQSSEAREYSELFLTHKDLDFSRSILAQRRDAVFYPEITHVANQFGQIALFRDWQFGFRNVVRQPQRTDLPTDFPLESASNLALVVNDLQNRVDVKRQLVEKLRLFSERVVDLTTKVQGGRIEVFLHEAGLKDPVPASRLSDGTLRFLHLLAILCHPEPPPLICIEEPEVGLHFDALHVIRDLLVEASQRTQLIVTTHSDILVSALSEIPEAVVVCERTAAGTQLQRLERGRLEEWLERYRLGDLWTMGHIGGTK